MAAEDTLPSSRNVDRRVTTLPYTRSVNQFVPARMSTTRRVGEDLVPVYFAHPVAALSPLSGGDAEGSAECDLGVTDVSDAADLGHVLCDP